MDLREFAHALLRWWYLSVLVVLLAVGGAALAWTRVEAAYTAQGSMVLLPPASSVESGKKVGGGTNPLLYLGGLSYARDVVVSSLASNDFVDEMASQYGATVTLGGQPGSSAPMVAVQVEGPTADTTIAALSDTLSLIPDRLVSLQDSLEINPSDRVTIQGVAQDSSADVSHKKQIEVSVAAFAVLGALGLLGIAVLDAARRRQRGPAVLEDTGAVDSPSTILVGPAEATAGHVQQVDPVGARSATAYEQEELPRPSVLSRANPPGSPGRSRHASRHARKKGAGAVHPNGRGDHERAGSSGRTSWF